MTRKQAEAALNEAKSALGRARRAVPKTPRGNPEAQVAFRIEQAQRHVKAALDAYWPEVKPDAEEE